MDALVASTYFIIVCLWLVVLGMVGLAYRRSPRTFGASHLLLAVVAIDTTRNIVENVFFGVYFSSRYNFINRNIITFLDHPYFILLPKLFNISAACVVIVLLLRRWLPMAQWERTRADDKIRQTTVSAKGTPHGVLEGDLRVFGRVLCRRFDDGRFCMHAYA